MKNTLPVRTIIFYNNGVAQIRREAGIDQDEFQIPVLDRDLDDVLKSINIHVQGGKVFSLEYESIKPMADRVASLPIISPVKSLTDIVQKFQGYTVHVKSRKHEWKGKIVGLTPMKEEVYSLIIFQDELIHIPVKDIKSLTLEKPDELQKFLHEVSIRENNRCLKVKKSLGDHHVTVDSIHPSSIWRMTYRVIVHSDSSQLTAYAIFDNPLDEQLEDVQVTLTTGVPVSFQYNLKSSFMPQRPVVDPFVQPLIAPPEFDQPLAASAMNESADWSSAKGHRLKMQSLGAGRSYSMGDDSYVAEEEEFSQAPDRTFGGVSRFDVPERIHLVAGGSITVPLFSMQLDGCKRRYLYNANKTGRHPTLTLTFKNRGSAVLERGPVTIYEEGEYGGESMLLFTPPHAEATLAFSQNQSIGIDRRGTSSEKIARIRLEGEFFQESITMIYAATYEIKNRSSQQEEIWIEHDIVPDSTLKALLGSGDSSAVEPAEKDLSFVRFKLSIPPSSVERLRVEESVEVRRENHFENTDFNYLESYRKLMDADLSDALEKFLKLKQDQHVLEEELQHAEEESARLQKKQKGVRENLSALGDRADENILRKKFLDKLEDLEEKFELSEKSVETTRQKIDKAQNVAKNFLKSLSDANKKKNRVV